MGNCLLSATVSNEKGNKVCQILDQFSDSSSSQFPAARLALKSASHFALVAPETLRNCLKWAPIWAKNKKKLIRANWRQSIAQREESLLRKRSTLLCRRLSLVWPRRRRRRRRSRLFQWATVADLLLPQTWAASSLLARSPLLISVSLWPKAWL